MGFQSLMCRVLNRAVVIQYESKIPATRVNRAMHMRHYFEFVVVKRTQNLEPPKRLRGAGDFTNIVSVRYANL